MWNPKEQPMLKIRTNTIIDYPSEVNDNMMEIRYKIHAEVLNAIDQEIVSTIVKAAREAGVTDLILIDKEFILSAIQHEMERRGLR
jgi:predicted transcriptional regulator